MLVQLMFLTNKDQIATNNKKKQNKKNAPLEMQQLFCKIYIQSLRKKEVQFQCSGLQPTALLKASSLIDILKEAPAQTSEELFQKNNLSDYLSTKQDQHKTYFKWYYDKSSKQITIC